MDNGDLVTSSHHASRGGGAGGPAVPQLRLRGRGAVLRVVRPGAPPPDDYSLRAYFGELTDQLASGDGKTARTFWTLVAKPGVLTADHLAGRRARYLRPIQLFLLVNVVLFVTAPQVPLFSYSLDKYLRYAPPSPELATRMVVRAHGGAAKGEMLRRAEAYQALAPAFDARVEA